MATEEEETIAAAALGGADEQLDAWLTILREDPAPPARELGAAGLREITRERARETSPGPPLHSVEDLDVPGDSPLAGRLYRPDPGPRPLTIFIHGGGFVFGSLDSHDRLCRQLALGAGVTVLAVDYRLAPEHRWPAGVDDAVRVFRFATQNLHRLGGTASPPALAGDSTGAAVATLACLRLRDEGDAAPAGLVLINPNTDLTLSSPSIEEKGKGWGLDAQDMRWFVSQWVPEGIARDDGRVSPLHARDVSGLPPALVITSEHDPLRDEGEAFADRLQDAGVPCGRRRELGLVHGYLTLDCDSSSCDQAAQRLFRDVGQLLG